jgi:ankyrin repeat protein
MMDSSNTLSGSPLTQTEQAELDTLLLKAAQDGDTDTVSALIAAGANINAVNQHGDTPLILAAFHGRTNTVSVLIAARANLNAADQYGNTALIFASLGGHTNIVSVLIAAGANLDAVNRHGNTALTFATHGGHDEIAFRLLDAMPSAPPPSNRRVPDRPAIISVKHAYNRASAEFSQGLTNILSALNEGTGQHALGTKNELLKIIAGVLCT